MMEHEDGDDRRKKIKCNHNRGHGIDCNNDEFEIYFNHSKQVIVAKCTKCGTELAVAPDKGIHLVRDNVSKCPECGHPFCRRKPVYSDLKKKGSFICYECGHEWGEVLNEEHEHYELMKNRRSE